MRTLNKSLRVIAVALGLAAGAVHAQEHGGEGAVWQSWRAENEVANLASLQRGARNFVGNCLGRHSLKYQRYSRTAEDLEIPQEQFEKYLLPPGEKATNYILSTLPATDAEAWFGKAPPDLSLIA